MATQLEGRAAELLSGKNYAIITTLAEDGSPHSAVVWIGVEDGKATINSAVGRKWPTQLDKDPRVAICVYDQQNPYEYVEVRGRVGAGDTSEEADRHIDGLAKKYLDADTYPFRQPGEQRIKYVVDAEHVRHQKQG
jgi:PPOX class probable F420-dependent enzyme